MEAKGKGQHEQCRRHGESAPRSKTARPSGTEQSESEAGLTAGWPGHGLSDGYDFGEGRFVTPLTALDELGVEVA